MLLQLIPLPQETGDVLDCLFQALSEAAAEEGELLAAQEQCSAGAARREASRQQTEAEVARLTSARYDSVM